MDWMDGIVISINRETRQQFDLLRLLVKKEITLKYKRTYLGIFWSLLNPLLTAIVYFFAFKVVMRFKMEHYSLYLLSALFPWVWFSSSIVMCTNTLTSNVSLIRKVIFPKHYLIISNIIGQLVTFICAIPILLGLSLYYGKTPGINWIIAIPPLIILQFFIIYGVALAVSMINAYFRDMQHLVSVGLNLLFWMTPIIYPIEMIPEKYRAFMALNPVAYLILSWRDVFLNNIIDLHGLMVTVIIAAVILFLGTIVYKRLESGLDEVL